MASTKRESATVVMDRCRKQIEKLEDTEDRRAVVAYLARKFPDGPAPRAQGALSGLS